MIHYQRKILIFRHEIVWFARHIPLISALNFTDYRQCEFSESKIGFIRRINTTIHIDLTKSFENIFSEFKSNTRYEIRRAIREKYQYKEIKDLVEFIEFYNKFAEIKKREKIKLHYFKYLINNLYISAAYSVEGECLVMHSYIIDKNTGNARLLHSASHFREISDKKERGAIGVANRYLHYKDIEFFLTNNYKKYDFGGISKNKNEDEINIAKFKKGFGGQELLSADYISVLLWLALRMKLLVVKIRKLTKR